MQDMTASLIVFNIVILINYDLLGRQAPRVTIFKAKSLSNTESNKSNIVQYCLIGKTVRIIF